MLKIGKRGFTLVELLAVIVVLSITVGVSIPIASEVITNSKRESLTVIVDEAEDYLTDQWKVKKMGLEVDEAFSTVFDTAPTAVKTLSSNNDLVNSMGISADLVSEVKVFIESDGIACVVVTKIPLSSNLYNGKYWTKEDGYAVPNSNNDRFYSKCCDVKRVYGV